MEARDTFSLLFIRFPHWACLSTFLSLLVLLFFLLSFSIQLAIVFVLFSIFFLFSLLRSVFPFQPSRILSFCFPLDFILSIAYSFTVESGLVVTFRWMWWNENLGQYISTQGFGVI
jgi:hypothetical protein